MTQFPDYKQQNHSSRTSLPPDLSRGVISWMATHSVAGNLLMLVFLLGGLFMAFSIKQEVFPESKSNMVQIAIAYPGASPEEVEKAVVLAVESAVEDLEGVDEMISSAHEGMALIRLKSVEGADINALWQKVANEVERISSFPEEAKKPAVFINNRKIEVMQFALYGDMPPIYLNNLADHVRDQMLAHKDISQVDLMGAREREIRVAVPLENIRRFGMTLSDVARSISKGSLELGAGTIKTESGDVLLRVKDRRNFADEYAKLPVLTSQDGSRILLEDIADVSENFAETDSWASFDGKPAILFAVYRAGDQTPAQVAKAVKQVMDEISQSLPAGMGIAVVSDMSKIFIQRADLLLSNAYIGLFLVFFFLALFLEIRLAFWVSMGIPISFLGSFLLLSSTDFSINLITMFAYIVTLGIVVDDAVVVGENIYYYRNRGYSAIQASILGARTVAVPVVFSVITNVVAFLPLWFLPGSVGRYFKHMPIVVVAVFLVSLIESLLILPAHLGHGRKRKLFFPLGLLERCQENFSLHFETFVHNGYGKMLSWILEYRYTLVAGGVSLFLITAGYVASGRMGMVLIPKLESDYAFCQAELVQGSSSELVRSVERRLVKAGEQVVAENGGDTLATGIFSHVSGNVVNVYIRLTSPDVRPIHTSRVAGLWRKKTGSITACRVLSFESDRGGPGSGKNFRLALNHKDQKTLEAAGQKLAAILADFPIVHDIDDGSARGKRQFDIFLTPEGQRMGLTSRMVADQIRHAFQGVVAVRNQRGNHEVAVRVSLPLSQRISMTIYENLVLQAPRGEILLKDAAKTVPGRAYTSITRTNGKRELVVSANIRPASRMDTIITKLEEHILPELVMQYPGLSHEFKGRQADMRDSMKVLVKGLFLALFCIFALLAIPFQSYFQPFIIMFSIPFGIIGAIAGHLIMGYSLSVISVLGIVALSGVVVNDGLVLIDLINKKIQEGISVRDAVWQSGIQRFRPILLTTLTTCGGLAPIILETSRQARFLIPMAISLGFGLLFATMITLALVPSLYLIFDDIKKWIQE